MEAEKPVAERELENPKNQYTKKPERDANKIMVIL
jgi:hypothetical protein